jgi:aspartate aminotransferase-like enzyme
LQGDAGKDLLRTWREKYGLVVAGGQGHLTGKIFRIGHLGAVTEQDVVATATALEAGLRDHGHRSDAGAAVAAVEGVLRAPDTTLVA